MIVDDFSTRFGVGNVDVHELWPELVSRYSGRNLSVSTDKLRAISGIAEALRRRLSLKSFHFGVWTDIRYLSQELAWFAQESLTCATSRRGTYPIIGRAKRSHSLTYATTAPSWSWAAWDGEISYMPGLTPNARLYITERELPDIDRVPSLWLRLGTITQIQPRRIHDGRTDEFRDWLKMVTSFATKETPVWPWLMKTNKRFDAIVTVHGRPVGVIKYDDKTNTVDGCTCLLLSRDQEFGERRQIYWYTLLILKRLEDGPLGITNSFRRVGIAEAV